MKIQLLLMLILIPIATATVMQECERIHSPGNIPCRVTTTYALESCNTYDAKIYNSSGSLLAIKDLGDFGIYCNFTFNFTKPGDYYYNVSTGDTGQILLKEEDNMIIGMLILAPLIFGLFLLIGAFSLSQEHAPLKIFLFLLSIVTFWTSLHFGLIALIKFYDFPELQGLIGSTVYWVAIIFGVLISYFVLYLIAKMTHAAAQKKEKDLEY